ncbi:MAG: radical SAM protein [Atribacterota bacterium]
MIKISNIRLGKATNSSSTHSMIFLPNHNEEDYEVEDGDFGWNYFTAASQETKNLYFYVLVKESLNSILKNQKYTNIILKELFSLDLPKDKDQSYIDHQSHIRLPANWDGTGINEQFAKELYDFISRPDILILGGNDNTDKVHPLIKDKKSKEIDIHKLLIDFDTYRYSNQLVARKDGDWWVFFNRTTGAKIRFSFNSSSNNDYKHSTFPELVDIKITNFCNENCPYCYQDSNVNGSHAECMYIYDIIQLLEEMQVFEVAIGGGEPTAHPLFLPILQRFRNEGIVPNFSTRSLAWLYDNELWPKILELCGGFAFSARSVKEVSKLGLLMSDGRSELYDKKAHIHYVMGTLKPWDFSRLLEEAYKWRMPVTLLGYKETGRGSNYTPNDYSNWVKQCSILCEERKLPKLNIDTSLAKDFQEELEAQGVPPYMYTIKEGAFSMYIDAVDGTYGPSSFCNPKNMLKLPKIRYIDNTKALEEIKKQYAKF